MQRISLFFFSVQLLSLSDVLQKNGTLFDHDKRNVLLCDNPMYDSPRPIFMHRLTIAETIAVRAVMRWSTAAAAPTANSRSEIATSYCLPFEFVLEFGARLRLQDNRCNCKPGWSGVACQLCANDYELKGDQCVAIVGGGYVRRSDCETGKCV